MKARTPNCTISTAPEAIFHPILLNVDEMGYLRCSVLKYSSSLISTDQEKLWIKPELRAVHSMFRNPFFLQLSDKFP